MGFGGSEAVVMWTLEALKRDYRVALLAGGRIDLPALNLFYGTSINPAECEIIEIPLPRPLAKADWGAALRGAFAGRGMRPHFDRFDVLVNAYNISPFGRAGIHFLADFSWDEDLRQRLDPVPRGPRGMLHFSAPIRKAYLALARAVAGTAPQLDASDIGVVIANSNWSRGMLRRHGIESQVLYPPVRVSARPPAPEKNRRRFICLGRISPEKRIERIITILGAVRARGHDLELHIIGDTGETVYGRQIEQLCQSKSSWIVLHGRQFGESRDRLLAESAFGIHARAKEPFGIAVAEMVAAGCIPFVPAEAGPAEIVEHNSNLTYETAEEAVIKIDEMLTNAAIERETREALRRRAQSFSAETFMRGIRGIVDDFVASAAAPVKACAAALAV